MSLIRALVVAMLLLAGHPGATPAASPMADYAVIVSRATLGDPAWKKVVDTVVQKHAGRTIEYDTLSAAREPLAARIPRYACFVATPAEVTREFVADVHRLTRRLDEDPYTDTIWGILTGFDADNALRIAQQTEALEIRRTAAGTDVALEMCDEGVWYSELDAGHIVRKAPGQTSVTAKGPADSTKSLVDALGEADLFVTSGHATERDWQIGFRYPNGTFQSKAGHLFGVDTQGGRHPVQSPRSKVYLAVGNCLMGHIDGPDAMALAWLNTAGVNQMVGYTVPTWFGYGGWGLLDYFVEQPGRFTLAEAFHANHQALLHRLETEFPDDARKTSAGETRNGLLFDRDVVAFYGDPAWVARMKPAPCAWEQELVEKDGVYTLTILPRRGARTFDPINTNGAQRGGRPVFAFLPHRIHHAVVTGGEEWKPLVTDTFVLVPQPKTFDASRPMTITFTAEAAE